MAILAVKMAFLKNFKSVVYGIYRSSGPHIWSSWAIISHSSTALFLASALARVQHCNHPMRYDHLYGAPIRLLRFLLFCSFRCTAECNNTLSVVDVKSFVYTHTRLHLPTSSSMQVIKTLHTHIVYESLRCARVTCEAQ